MIAADLADIGAPDLVAPLLPGIGSVVRPVTLDEPGSKALLDLALGHRLGSVLADAVQSGRITVTDSAIGELNTALEHLLASQLKVERNGMQVLDALIERGIEFRVLKGMASAYLDYPNPAMRQYGDLDLLVQPSDMDAAIDTLSVLDDCQFDPVRGGDWRVQHALQLRVGDVEVDLHHRLLHQAAGHRAARFDLFADPVFYDLAGRRVAAQPGWLRLVVAAAQNVIGGTHRTHSDLDVARLAEWIPLAQAKCGGVGLGWVISEGIFRSQQNLDWSEPALESTSLSSIDRWFRRVYDDVKPMQARFALELALAEPAISVTILKSAIRPGRDYLEMHSRNPRQQLLRQLRRIRR